MPKKVPWEGFETLAQNFLGKYKATNYEETVNKMLKSYRWKYRCYDVIENAFYIPI